MDLLTLIEAEVANLGTRFERYQSSPNPNEAEVFLSHSWGDVSWFKHAMKITCEGSRVKIVPGSLADFGTIELDLADPTSIDTIVDLVKRTRLRLEHSMATFYDRI